MFELHAYYTILYTVYYIYIYSIYYNITNHLLLYYIIQYDMYL